MCNIQRIMVQPVQYANTHKPVNTWYISISMILLYCIQLISCHTIIDTTISTQTTNKQYSTHQYDTNTQYASPTTYYIPLQPVSDMHGRHTVSMTVGSNSVSMVVDTGSVQTILFGSGSNTTNICSIDCYNPGNNILSSILGTTIVALADDNESIEDTVAYVLHDTIVFTVQTYNQNNSNSLMYNNASIVYSTNLQIGAPQNSGLATALNAYPNNIAGIMGLGYSVEGGVGYSSTWLQLIAAYSIVPEQPIIALNYDLNNNNSYMNVGGLDIQYIDTIQYSAPYTQSLYHEAYIYNLQVCNIPMLSQLQINAYTVIVDTGSTCLSLPAELFDMMTAWIPAIHCIDAIQPASPQSSETVLCYIATDAVQLLPTLSFTMCATCTNVLYIDLTYLILYDSTLQHPTLGYRLCINRAPAIDSGYSNNFITFGARILQQLYFVSNMQLNVIGFAQKSIGNNTVRTSVSNIQCAVPIQCTGVQQQYYAGLNTCIQPSCTDYFLFTENSDGTGCVVSSTFYALLCSVLTVYVVSEMGLLQWKQQLHKKIVSTIPAL